MLQCSRRRSATADGDAMLCVMQGSCRELLSIAKLYSEIVGQAFILRRVARIIRLLLHVGRRERVIAFSGVAALAWVRLLYLPGCQCEFRRRQASVATYRMRRDP